jgi:hypothetical protein
MREKPQIPKNSFIMLVKKVMKRIFMLKRKKGLSLRKICKRRNRHNYMENRCIESKNHGHKKARAGKLKGQCNENLSLVKWLTMCYVSGIGSNKCKRGGDNQSLTYKKARGQNLKGEYNGNFLLYSCLNGESKTWKRVTMFLKNGTRQFQIIGKRNILSKVPVVGIQSVCGESLSQDPKRGEELKCIMEGIIKHDDD